MSMDHIDVAREEAGIEVEELQEVYLLERLDPWTNTYTTLQVYLDGEKADAVCEALNAYTEWTHRVVDDVRPL